MARIAGIDLPREKRIEIALTYIHGIGSSQSKRILGVTKVDVNTRTKDLTEDEVLKIREFIDKELKVEGDLRRDVSQSIKRLMEIASYRGMRHRKSLPVRGQRTHTNARTRKGPKPSVGARKKERA